MARVYRRWVSRLPVEEGRPRPRLVQRRSGQATRLSGRHQRPPASLIVPRSGRSAREPSHRCAFRSVVWARPSVDRIPLCPVHRLQSAAVALPKCNCRSGRAPASFRRSGLSHLAAEELYSSSKKCCCLSDRTHGRIDREELFRHEALTDRDVRSELQQPRRRGWPDAVRVRCRRLPVSLNSDNSVAAYHQVRHQHWGARPDRNGFRQTTSRHSRARWYCSSASRQIAELRGPEVRRSLLSPATANGFAAGYDDVIGGFE